MELFDVKEFEKYISSNYELIHEDKTDYYSSQIGSSCDSCKRDAFLKIYSSSYLASFGKTEFPRFINLNIQCPNCHRLSFLQTVQFKEVQSTSENDNITYTTTFRLYKIGRIPISEENYINNDIPMKYDSLRRSASEAEYCLTNSKFIASSILYRRGVQIMVKDILGGKGPNLFKQVEWLKSNDNKLKADLTEVFHENALIIKDIGNQGAHPDKDPTLHNFTKDDAYGLHDLFISLIHEVFVKPASMKALQEELKKSRKLKK